METPKFSHTNFGRHSTPVVAGHDTNTPMSNGTLSKYTSEKVSILPIKNSLNTALRQQWNTYWTTLRQFIKGKIGKAELQMNLKKILVTKELGM